MLFLTSSSDSERRSAAVEGFAARRRARLPRSILLRVGNHWLVRQASRRNQVPKVVRREASRAPLILAASAAHLPARAQGRELCVMANRFPRQVVEKTTAA